MPYPELFWSWYTGLGSQIQTPKRSKVLISGVSFRQRSLLQSQKRDVLSYSERKIAKNFQGFAPGPHWGGLTAPPQTPPLHNGFSPRYARRKTGTPKKLLDTALNTCHSPFLKFPLLIHPSILKTTFLNVLLLTKNPANIYLLKVNNRNNRKRCEICSELTIKTPERHWRRSGVFVWCLICASSAKYILLTCWHQPFNSKIRKN